MDSKKYPVENPCRWNIPLRSIPGTAAFRGQRWNCWQPGPEKERGRSDPCGFQRPFPPIAELITAAARSISSLVITRGGTRRRLPSAAQLTSTPFSAHFFCTAGQVSPRVIPIISPRYRGWWEESRPANRFPLSGTSGRTVLNHPYRCPGCCTRQRAAGKRAPVLPFPELKPLPGEQRPHGKSACDPFCERHDVRRDTGMLDGKPLPGPPHPGLDFVSDHQRPVPVAGLPDTREEVIRGNDHAGLSLDRFHKDPGNRPVNCLSRALQGPRIPRRCRRARAGGTVHGWQACG